MSVRERSSAFRHVTYASVELCGRVMLKTEPKAPSGKLISKSSDSFVAVFVTEVTSRSHISKT